MKHPNAEIENLLHTLAQTRGPTIQLGLERVRGLLAAMGNPEKKLPPVVHVAGTNGKGSLLAYLKAILEAAGYRVHRYTSPHLVLFNERIQLAGKDIGDEYLLEQLQRVHRLMQGHTITFFEASTALAFQAFADIPADIVLLETGLGGRLDATNVVEHPLLTAITPVSMDHMDFLGNTIASIAAEKAGILKKGTLCITGEQVPEALATIEQVAGQVGAGLFRHGQEWSATKEHNQLVFRSNEEEWRYSLPALIGEHQIGNAGTAIACVRHLHGFTLQDEHINAGLAKVEWPARLQRLRSGTLAELVPEGSELWLDGGHNESAGQELARWVQAQVKPVHIICGMLGTKDSEAFLKPLANKVASFSSVAIEEEPLTRTAEELCGIAQRLGMQGYMKNNIKNAIQCIVNVNIKDNTILVCGSLSLAGNTLWQNSTKL